jgi:hypothetical protein
MAQLVDTKKIISQGNKCYSRVSNYFPPNTRQNFFFLLPVFSTKKERRLNFLNSILDTPSLLWFI